MTRRLKIDFENGAADLGPGQGVMVPRGAMHCPHAIGRTVVLMFEAGTVVPMPMLWVAVI